MDLAGTSQETGVDAWILANRTIQFTMLSHCRCFFDDNETDKGIELDDPPRLDPFIQTKMNNDHDDGHEAYATRWGSRRRALKQYCKRCAVVIDVNGLTLSKGIVERILRGTTRLLHR